MSKYNPIINTPRAFPPRPCLPAETHPKILANFKKGLVEVLRIVSQRIVSQNGSPICRINTLVERCREIREKAKVKRKISLVDILIDSC